MNSSSSEALQRALEFWQGRTKRSLTLEDAKGIVVATDDFLDELIKVAGNDDSLAGGVN